MSLPLPLPLSLPLPSHYTDTPPRASTLTFAPRAFASQKEDHLLLAVPKKGRLYERVIHILQGAGLDHIRANRLDVAPCLRQPVTIVFLPAADIAK